MEITLEGYLNSDHNLDLFAQVESGPLNNIKHIYIKILDDEDVDKLKNILKQWSSNNKIYTPISYADEGGLLIKINTQKLSKYMGILMLKTERKEWFNKKFKVRFLIKKYSFVNNFKRKENDEYDNKSKIHGIHFILKNIELLI